MALLSGPDQVIFCALYAQGLDILQCCNTEIVENSDTSQMFILFVVVLFCTECTFSHCKCLEKIAANVVINIVGHHCSTGTLCLCTPCLPVCEQSFQNIYHIASGDMISLTTAKRRYADYSLCFHNLGVLFSPPMPTLQIYVSFCPSWFTTWRLNVRRLILKKKRCAYSKKKNHKIKK